MMGMLYRYIKVVLYNLKPKTQEPGEIMRMLRNINQQSHAFTREMQENLVKSKLELSKMIPSLRSDYLESKKKEVELQLESKLNFKDETSESKYKPKKETSKDNTQGATGLSGTSIFEDCIAERRKIIDKKKNMEVEKNKLF